MACGQLFQKGNGMECLRFGPVVGVVERLTLQVLGVNKYTWL